MKNQYYFSNYTKISCLELHGQIIVLFYATLGLMNFCLLNLATENKVKKHSPHLKK